MLGKGSFSEQVVDKPPQALGHPRLLGPEEMALFTEQPKDVQVIHVPPLGRGAEQCMGTAAPCQSQTQLAGLSLSICGSRNP